MTKGVLVVVVLAGCLPPPVHHPATNCAGEQAPTSGGHRFNPARAAELHVNDSTVDDATCVLGQPFATTLNGADGSTLVTWMYVDAGMDSSRHFASHGDTLILRFDADTRLLGVISATHH